MKKGMAVLVAAALFFGVAGEVQAQALGIRGGMNFSTFGGGDDATTEDIESTSGPVAGVFLNLNPNGFWSIQPEVHWSQMGAKGSEDGFEAKLKLTYIQVPILARVNFAGTAGGLRPHFLIGPAVAFNLGCDYEVEAGGQEFEGDCDEEDTDIGEIKDFEFAAVFGAGVGLPLGPGEFSVDGRLYQGLTSIFDSEDDDGDLKNEAWQIMAGFSFPFGMR